MDILLFLLCIALFIYCFWRLRSFFKKPEDNNAHSSSIVTHTSYVDDDEEDDWREDWAETLVAFLERQFDSREEKAYRELFGGDNQCRFNLRMFHSRCANGRTLIYAEKNNHYRPRYDTLVKTGAVISGDQIPLESKIEALKMTELRKVADEVKATRKAKKEELATSVLEQDKAAVAKAYAHIMPIVMTDDQFLFDRDYAIKLVDAKLNK